MTDTRTADQRLADIADAIDGNLTNGPWLLITDPDLRRVVGEYVADTCHSIAAAAGLNKGVEQAHDLMPLRLATTLPGTRTVADARDRLARHLFLQERTDEWAPREWDLPAHVNQAPYLRRADEILNDITG